MPSKKLSMMLGTPLGLVIVLGVLVAVVELLIMLVAHDILVPVVFSETAWGFIDATLLTLIVAPALFFMVFRRMQEEISERKQAEVALIAAKNEAERANVAKSRFLSSMSHELRTPMNAVLGFAQLLQMDASLQDDHRESVGLIREAGGHLLELINQVLNLAQIESGSIEFVVEPVALSDVFNDCLVLTLPLANERGIQIEDIDCSDIVLHADRLRLKQVLLNLLSNAIKYNRPNGHIKIRCSSEDGCLARIMVSDTGQGIPPERMDELFQPFSRLGAENGIIQGSGIGLTISRQLVELMGGAIGVDSTPGTGSTFWIELPQEIANINRTT